MKVDNLFTQSSFESTENVTDLALQGNSFFALKAPTTTGPLTQNQALLTRAGAFRVDANLTLVNPDAISSGYPGNAIKFSDNAAGIAAALATLTTELTALQTKTTTLDASAQALVDAADADFATATANLPGLLAPLQTKATDLDTSADGLVTAATAAVTTAQSDLKTALSPLQAKAAVLDTKALALQDAAAAAVTTAADALYYDAVDPSGSLYVMSQLLENVGVLGTAIAGLDTAVNAGGSGATPAEVAASGQIVAGLTAAQTAVANAILAPDDPAVIATAQQAVSNLTTLITNSSGIFVDHAPGANLQATYAAINPAPVEAQALVVAGDATTLATALTAQTTADSVKNATAAALTQVDTAYNAAAPTVAQANDALLALTNAGTIISGASAVFAETAKHAEGGVD